MVTPARLSGHVFNYHKTKLDGTVIDTYSSSAARLVFNHNRIKKIEVFMVDNDIQSVTVNLECKNTKTKSRVVITHSQTN
jgi:hypothetical protein